MKAVSLSILTLFSSALIAADNCNPTKPAPCNQDTCSPCYCAGPADVIANAPVFPRTCDGDFHIEASVLYWKTHQDGMEYAVKTNTVIFLEASLIDGEYKTPNFRGEFGFKAGVGYHFPCDGWDVNLRWTYSKGSAFSQNEVSNDQNLFEDGEMLVSLWSAFQGIQSNFSSTQPFVSDIETHWNSKLHLIDLTLGRNYWVSKYLSLHPLIGLRGAQIDQAFSIEQRGGVFDETDPFQPSFNDEVNLKNDYRGVGVLAGFAANWHFGCGWSIYSEFAASALYGRFDIKHDEEVREAESPFSKSKVLETTDKFRASRGVLDFILGIEYATLICDCQYGITACLAWEQHLFFHQNQLFRVSRVGNAGALIPFPNNSGENFIDQSRGTLSTGGLTFTLGFDF